MEQLYHIIVAFSFFCCCPAYREKNEKKGKEEGEERRLPSPILLWPGALRATQIMKGENTICIPEHAWDAQEEVGGEEKEEMGGKKGVRKGGRQVVRVTV